MDDLVQQRREGLAAKLDPAEREAFEAQEDPRSSLAGLALSGGGIRSATFALGVLQALGESKLLWIFDYLSTVSGGGYVGGWWSAWLSRPDRTAKDGLFPDDERLEPDRFPATLLDEHNVPTAPPKNLPEGTPDASRSAWLKDPIHHLRLFSNYLTPRKGALSGDTWRAVTVVSRNLLLTWAVLLPVLLAAVLLAQLYFAGNRATGALFVCSRPDSVAADTVWRATVAGEPGTIREIHRTSYLRMEPGDACRSAGPPNGPGVPHGTVVRGRLGLLLDPLLAAALVIGALVVIWMLYGGGNALVSLLGFVAVGGGFVLLFKRPPTAVGLEWWEHLQALLWTERSFWVRAGEVGAALVLLVGGLAPLVVTKAENLRRKRAAGRPLRPEEKKRVARDRVRNLVVHWHAGLLVGSTVVLLILLVAGFGHELVWFLFYPGTGAAGAAVRKAGGWAAVALTIGSGLFTLLRAGPTHKGKDAAAESPNLATKAVFAMAPLLVLAALPIAAAALGHWLYATRAPEAPINFAASAEVSAALVGIALLALYTLYERWTTGGRGIPPESWQRRLNIVAASLLALIVLLAVAAFRPEWAISWSPLVLSVLLAAAGLLVSFRLNTTRPDGTWASLMTRAYAGSPKQQTDLAMVKALDDKIAASVVPVVGAALASDRRAVLKRPRNRALGMLALTAIPAALVAVGLCAFLTPAVIPSAASVIPSGASVIPSGVSVIPSGARDLSPLGGMLPALAMAGLGFGLVFLALDLALSRRDGDRSTWLAALVVLASGALFALHYQPRISAVTGFLGFGVAFSIFLIAGVVGLGWTTDPNLMALHNFYKSRLVRAFLGASNTARKDVEITETAAGDDLKLKDLKNHLRGAPIQIINTTLNLVGGRDLATAQRFAAPFTMSSEICGSARTGYHRTQDYMDGTLSLGTAVATSGAAVSTNMGSKTMSSALSLLLALFNVRLGIWAPTPNKERWYERQPRLWPFYLLREALSQTNDLGPYCYLTDGGHFDNTGLYSLVERGCRYIMVLDDGADVLPCFSDMGDAIRRCRIDFGAEIEFTAAVDKFLKAKDGQLAMVHYARGTIRYAAPHLRMLGWSDQEIAECSVGRIVWVKPMVTPRDSVDIRQYKLENSAFPQQTTADQWYDESQFESYRALGYQSVMSRLTSLAAGSVQSPSDIEAVFRAF